MAVLNEHKKIAYRVQKWLVTRPANIVDSERPNERVEWRGKVINFGVGRMQIQEVAKGRD